MVRACTGLVCVRSTRPESSGRDEEGVHHRAGRVVAADVERVEVQPLRLELGAVGDLVAHAHEDVGDPLGERGQRVPGAARGAVPGQRDVDPLLGQHAGVALGLELGQPRLVGLRDRLRGRRSPACRRRCGRPAAARRARGGPAAPARGRPGGRAGRRPAPPGRRRRERLLRGAHRVVERLRGERGDLLGVVGIVGARHGRPFCPSRGSTPRPGLMAEVAARRRRPGSARRPGSPSTVSQDAR